MPVKRLKQYLDENGVRYLSITHSPAYTAQAIAHAAHVSGKEMAKTVILKVNGELAMAVLPATHKVNLDVMRDELFAETVELATERDFLDAFPGCELGAMPPFGNLWDIPVFVAERLTEDETIVFNAGTHTECIQMSFDDFEELVNPRIVRLTRALA